jgi:RNA recognition motif-containing protein
MTEKGQIRHMENQNTNTTVYISNLNYQCNEKGLKSLFSPFGSIRNVKIIVEPKTGQSRGMAFVEMNNMTEAKKAIAGLHMKEIDGRTVKAKPATPLKPKSISKFQKEVPETKFEVKKKFVFKKK